MTEPLECGKLSATLKSPELENTPSGMLDEWSSLATANLTTQASTVRIADNDHTADWKQLSAQPEMLLKLG
jgi:hypothetical protein